MNIVSNQRRRGVAVIMHNNCLESLRYIRGVLKHYNEYSECVLTNESMTRCFNGLARTKRQTRIK